MERDGFNVWLDYRSLVPGTPWAEQIDQGILEADVILLVVSQAAIASQYVEMEWHRMLTEGKRVVLAIFEAVDLPPALEKFEWVDFRGMSSLFSPILYVGGNVLMLFLMIWKRADVRRCFPAKG